MTAIALVFFVLALVQQAFAIVLLVRFMSGRKGFDRRHPLDFTPPGISILVPIKGPVSHLRPALEALLSQRYPGPLELILAFQDANDPSLEETRSIVGAYSGPTQVRLLQGLPFVGFNPKNSNLWHAAKAASHPWLFTCDIDTRLEPEHLKRCMQLARGDSRRFVTAATVHEGPRDLAATLETIGTNLELVNYFLSVYAIEKKPGPVNGAAHLFHRDLLASVGGMELVINKLTEDAVFEQAFIRAGATGYLAPDLVRVRLEHHTLNGFIQRHLRWLMIARCFKPILYKIAPFFWTGQWLCIFGLLLGQSDWVTVGVAILLSRVLQSLCFQILMETPLSDWPKSLSLLIYDALTPHLFLGSAFKRHVQWAGNLLVVERDGSLVRK